MPHFFAHFHQISSQSVDMLCWSRCSIHKLSWHHQRKLLSKHDDLYFVTKLSTTSRKHPITRWRIGISTGGQSYTMDWSLASSGRSRILSWCTFQMRDCFSISEPHLFTTISFQADGNKFDMISDKGFDDFVNLLESNPLSKNPKFYGALHNSGHVSVCNSSNWGLIMIFCDDRLWFPKFTIQRANTSNRRP